MQAAIKTAHAERFVSAFADFPANTVFYQPPTGQWTHLAMTYDGALIKIYANGVQVGEDTKTGNITGDNVPFDIGGRSAGLKFTGLIDEVEVFNGALTSQEIFDIYSAVTLGKCKHGLIQFSAPTYVVNEGSPSVIIRVKRTDGGVGAVSVHYATSTVDFATADSTATTVDGDYVATNGTLTFAPGDTTKQFTVLVNGDTKFENDETFVANLTNPTNATISDDQGVGTITNDDAPPSFSIDDVIHNEGNTGTTSYTFTVTKTGSTALSASVDYETMDGTAVAPGDYTAIPITTLTFAPGDTKKQVTVLVNGDTTVEADETFTVKLTTPTDATITDDEGLGTIVNDDTAVSVTISAPSTVLEDGTQNLTYTFTRSPETSGNLTVNFSVGGTAMFGSDYTQTGAATFGTNSGTVTIPDGQTTATVTIDPTADNVAEPDETVILTVTSGGYNVGSPSAATGTIQNDDATVTVSVSPAAVDEDGATNLVYTFTRDPLLTGPLTIEFSVSGTATFNTDYTVTGADSFTSTSGTVTFADGSNTATVTIDPTADNTYELNETVILTVGSGTGYSAGAPGAATGTITNDDTAPTLTIGDRIAFEGNTGTTNFVFTVTKSGSTEVPVTVNFATADGTSNPATGGASCGPGTDYVSQSGMLTFPATGAGSTSQTITIGVCADTTFEPNETFFVELSGETNATLADGEGRGTIQNDDTPPPLSPVNTTDDVNDGICNAAHCSLREAIITANGSSGAVP